MSNIICKIYRCTRNVYPPGTPGYTDKKSRQGHYVPAQTEAEAIQKMVEMFPNDTDGFTVDLDMEYEDDE